MAASFQESVLDVLIQKTEQALERYSVNHLIVAGGVAANLGLRAELEKLKKRKGIQISIPPLALCTDNAAMIGAAGYVAYQNGVRAGMDCNAEPGLNLDDFSS